MGSGIGGTSALLDVSGWKVFVKRVPLTARELRPENVRSTANLFELPTFCHYGVGLIGGPGFGAWRELATHVSIALFLEHIQHNLHDWLGDQVGSDTFENACAMVERELQAGTSFMNARGLLHFDGHFQNVLTDGERLYFADYGLAISPEFDLSEAEKEFLAEHQAYDRRYTVTHLVLWLRGALRETGVPPQVAAIIERHAPVAEVMTDFYRRFQQNPQLSARFWNASSTSTQPPELSS